MPEEEKLLFIAVVGTLLLSCLLSAGEPPGGQAQSPPKCPCGIEAPILEVPIASFRVQNANMAEALSQLVSADRKHIVIGFEQVPQAEGQKAGPISLNLTKVKLSEVVRLLCQADARYEYQMVESPVAEPSLRGSMIEVHPKGALENQSDLLNTRVRDYKVDADITANSAIEHIQEDATELREALYRKAEEWRKETGRQAGGVPGSLISGNMVPPRFTLQLHDVTVRQILDAISMKSIQMSKQGPDFDSSGRGVKWAPTGWQYDFVIAPDAPTGLGGNPKWEPF